MTDKSNNSVKAVQSMKLDPNFKEKSVKPATEFKKRQALSSYEAERL